MPFSMADILAAYGGSPDPENPSSGEITPGLVLRGLQAIDQGGSQAFGKMATDIATLPRRAIQGAAQYQPGIRREDVTDIPGTAQPADVAVAPATEAAMNLVGFGSPFAQPGSAGIFGGRLAKSADLGKLAQAEDMAAKGASKQEIWDTTGWFQGAEGGWRFEIPDTTANLSQRIQENVAAGKGSRPGTTGKGFEHPDLYAAYPELSDVKMLMGDPAPVPGYMSRGGVMYQGGQPQKFFLNSEAYTPEMSKALGDLEPGVPGMRSTGLHELQHMVQNIEGFARGGTPNVAEVKDAAQSYILNRRSELRAQMDELNAQRDAWLKREGNPPLSKDVIDRFNAENPGLAQKAMEVSRELGSTGTSEYRNAQLFKHYENLAGEVESGNVQARRDLTPEQLRATPPWETQRIPFSEQLLRLSEGPGLGPKRYKETYPSFSERMGTAQDVAFAGRQRGTGNIVPRSTANEAPLLAPGETRGDLQAGLTPGMAPAEESIADVGRRSFRERLGLGGNEGLELSAAKLPTEAPYPQFAEQYPATRRPTMVPRDKGPGMRPEKTLTKEAEGFAKTREKIQAQMDEEGYQPFFDPSQRFPAEFAKQPGPHVDTAQALAKKQATIEEHLKTIGAPETLANLRQAYSRGLDLPDSQNWYFLGQLERKAIDSLGEEAGRKWFRDNYATAMASTTTGMNPKQNLIMAQYLNYLRTTGRPYPTASHQTPVTVGGQRTMPNVEAYEKAFSDPRGPYESLGLENPKRTDFTQAQMGNPNAFTMDEQMTSGMIGEDVPKKGTYGLLTSLGRKEAGRSGVDPQNYQDVAWAGFKKMLEEESRASKGFRPYGPGEGYQGKPMIAEINDMIERTHRLTGMPREEIFERGFLRHQIPLYGIGGAVTLGNVLMGQSEPPAP